MSACTWEEREGKWICLAKECIHWAKNGCKLGKVSLSCDNTDCKWHSKTLSCCVCMDVHLDANGKCMSVQEKASGRERS